MDFRAGSVLDLRFEDGRLAGALGQVLELNVI